MSPASGPSSLTWVSVRLRARRAVLGQRGEVAHLGVGEVEGLQGGELGQRGEVAHLGVGEVEGLQGV